MVVERNKMRALAIFLAAVLPTVTTAEPLAPVACLIAPYEVIELASPVEGIVAEVLVNRGDRVSAGQIVARLDATVERVALDAAKARAHNHTALAGARARLEFLEDAAIRNEQLAARNSIARSTAQEARMEAETARQQVLGAEMDLQIAAIDLEAARARLDQKILRSPIDGLVTARDVSVGEFRDGRSQILTIARLDVLRVEAFIPISYFPRLALDQIVTIQPEAPIGGRHAARITVIDQVFDAASATLGIVMDLPNPELSLPAGLRCTVTFDTP